MIVRQCSGGACRAWGAGNHAAIAITSAASGQPASIGSPAAYVPAALP